MKKTIITGLATLLFSTVSYACLQNDNVKICPGDRATVKYVSGTVEGINPRQNLVSVRFDSGAIQTYPIEMVSVGKGCLQGYCVGDRATVQYASGKIVGINPIATMISVLFDSGAIQTYPIDDVSVGKGCVHGYCVGDRATVQYSSGRIIGINPKTEKVSVLFDSHAIQTYPIDYVSINSYCLEYPENHSARLVSSAQEFKATFNK